ncbi:AN1-type zinc finger domain-containing protein [Haloarcula japonica]|uniref:AN1-type zinc finger domain-containing protein n=1 Tax=Haloarcula japonica TaxID=29282 RepID=UPI0039F728BE
MSEQCAVCSESDQLLHDCNYCKKAYCPEHTLPEKHKCVGLKQHDTDTETIPDNAQNVSGTANNIKKPDIERISDEKSSSQDDNVGSKTRPEPLSEDEVTTYGGSRGEFESSPDIAADGSLKTDESNIAENPDSKAGILQRLLSTLKFWT